MKIKTRIILQLILLIWAACWVGDIFAQQSQTKRMLPFSTQPFVWAKLPWITPDPLEQANEKIEKKIADAKTAEAREEVLRQYKEIAVANPKDALKVWAYAQVFVTITENNLKEASSQSLLQMGDDLTATPVIDMLRRVDVPNSYIYTRTRFFLERMDFSEGQPLEKYKVLREVGIRLLKHNPRDGAVLYGQLKGLGDLPRDDKLILSYADQLLALDPTNFLYLTAHFENYGVQGIYTPTSREMNIAKQSLQKLIKRLDELSTPENRMVVQDTKVRWTNWLSTYEKTRAIRLAELARAKRKKAPSKTKNPVKKR